MTRRFNKEIRLLKVTAESPGASVTEMSAKAQIPAWQHQ